VACVVAGAAGASSCAAVAQRGMDAVVARRPTGGPMLALMQASTLPVGTPAEARVAERRLLESLRKPTDGVFSRYLNRRISLFLTRLLMNTGVHPNQVSLFTLALGVVAGVVCACGGWLAALVGVLCLEIHSIVDGVDGELARLKHLRSKLGACLDTASDDLAINSLMIGLTVNLWRGGATWALAVGVIAVLASLTGRGVVYWLLSRVYDTGDQLQLAWQFDSAAGQRGVRRVAAAVLAVLRACIKRDCFATVFVVLALLGRADVVLLLCCAFTVGYLVALAAQMRHLRAGHAAAAAAPPIPGPARDPKAARQPRPVRRAPTLELTARPRAA
jgi:phosphatidylglycerophosphate synthase